MEIVGEAARFAPVSRRSKARRFAYMALPFNNLQMSLHENLRLKKPVCPSPLICEIGVFCGFKFGI
jgi:hypothetical protein